MYKYIIYTSQIHTKIQVKSLRNINLIITLNRSKRALEFLAEISWGIIIIIKIG